MTPIRVGLVGAGYIGQRHLKHLSAHPGAEVVGIYDTDPARLQELKEKGYGIFSSYSELIGACEAIFITSPLRIMRMPRKPSVKENIYSLRNLSLHRQRS
jgi:predicted dehydrogenase